MTPSEWTSLIIAVVGTGGVGATVKIIVTAIRRNDPPPDAQEAAAAAVAAPREERDAVAIARLALASNAGIVERMAVMDNVVMDAREEMVTLRHERDDARRQRDDARRERDAAREKVRILLEYVQDIRGNWHIIRVSETAPEIPKI